MGTLGKRWVLFGLAVFGFLLPALAIETNFWPAFVQQVDSPLGRDDHVGSLGPIFSITQRQDTRILSIRPFWTSFIHQDTESYSVHILYPLVSWYDRGPRESGNSLTLLQYYHDAEAERTFFQLFPFIFINNTPDPESSYYAFWPVGGVLKHRFWRDKISFVAWPLFVRTHKGDETWTHFPYPFLGMLNGPRSWGFRIWPLYGHAEREQDYRRTWALWPIFYNYHDKLDEQVPYVRFGILPFYHRETGAGLKAESFIWPFFGYTRENEPRPQYSENRYFWPFLVQGRGEEQYKNRWMPLYTHETRPGRSKHWYLWPLLKTETLEAPGLVRDRTSVLYFLYRDEQQHFADTTARLTTLWPLAGYWNDGHGRRQLQMFDPLTVFFPSNEKVKENWTPLFALYRFDERNGDIRHSLLWDLLVWEKDVTGCKAFYAGPFFEWVQGDHWEVLKGLIGSSTENNGRRMRFFWKH